MAVLPGSSLPQIARQCSTFAHAYRKYHMVPWDLSAAVPLLLLASMTSAAPATRPADVAWQSRLLDYARPARMDFQETTPTQNQLSFHSRPRSFDSSDFTASTKRANPRTLD